MEGGVRGKSSVPKAQIIQSNLMKTKTTLIVFTAVVIGAAFALVQTRSDGGTADADLVSRGRYLVRLGGCTDCHSPKRMTPTGPVDDEMLFLSGHPETVNLPTPELKPGPWLAATAGMTAWTGPWGISYAANITPDVNTGIGIWTEEMFFKAMRTGKHMGEGRPILPPMPWQALEHLTDSDLRAVFAYLKSVPAVRNRVPAPVSPDGSQISE